jgi:phosphate transport system substrate-binding protein
MANYYIGGFFNLSLDNNAQWLWLGLFLVALLLILLRIWRPFKAKTRRLAALALSMAILLPCAALSGYRLYENGLLTITEKQGEIDLREYRPFYEDTLAVSLAEPSAFAFQDDPPNLDGATALYPLYSAFVRATYPEANYEPYYAGDGDPAAVLCSTTSDAFKNLINGSVDVIFLMDVSDAQRAVAEELRYELKMTQIGREAFVFMVNSKNKVQNLSRDAIRDIYSGAAANWSQVTGGEVRGKIEPYQRPEGSGSQTALEKIMNGTPIMEAKEKQVYSSMLGLFTTLASYKNYKTAIGYSFRYYINTMLNDEELKQVKLLSIDGVAPTAESIENGEYPFAQEFYAVTIANRTYETDAERRRAENAERLIEWIRSEQGQSLVEQTGYVRVERKTP